MTSRTLTFLAGLEDSPSPRDGPDSEQSPSVKSSRSARKSSRSIGPTSLSMTTSEPLSGPGKAQLCLPGASPASLSVTPGSDEARKMTATSGRKCSESFKKQGPLGSLVRMLLESSTWNSTKCLLTWKARATKSGRLLFQLAPSTPRIEGIGFGSSGGLLKTPSTVEAESEGRKSLGVSGTSGTLSQEMASGFIERRMPTLLKTPSTVETEGGVMEIRPGCDGHYKLRDQIAMLQTPSVEDAGREGSAKAWRQYTEEGRTTQCRLRNQIAMLPTPKAGNPGSRPNQKGGKILAEEVKKAGTSRGLKLQPAFVEWMMGYPRGFTDVGSPASKPSGTPSSRKSPTKSSKRLLKSKREV